MKELFYVNQLISIYGVLLTEKQLDYIKSYYYDDLSFTEIAENKSVSRNAIFKNIKSSISQLEIYESKLKIIQKLTKIKSENLNKEEIIKLIES